MESANIVHESLSKKKSYLMRLILFIIIILPLIVSGFSLFGFYFTIILFFTISNLIPDFIMKIYNSYILNSTLLRKEASLKGLLLLSIVLNILLFISYKEINDLEYRISYAESIDDDLESKIDDLESQISELSNR